MKTRFKFVTVVPDTQMRFGDPWFMAFAYRDYLGCRTVFAVPPLNKLIAWTRRLYHWLYAPSWGKFDEAVNAEVHATFKRMHGAHANYFAPLKDSYHALDDLPGE